jgi:cell division protein FtsI (penicillin-binding protein 3)
MVRRFRALGLLLLLVCTAKVCLLKIVCGDALAKMAQAEQVRRRGVSAPRGSICDRKGEILAISTDGRRCYPLGPLALSVLGALDPEQGRLCGVELEYDAWLREEQGWETRLVDSRSKTHFHPDMTSRSAQAGATIYLTIDADLQVILEDELWTAIQEHRARGGTAIVLERKTGEILAMASFPGWDCGLQPLREEEILQVPDSSRAEPVDCIREALRNARGPISETVLRNRAISDVYEPGSVFKIVTLAAALETNTFSPTDRIFGENGAYRVDAHRTIHEAEGHRFGWLTLREAFAHSSNICMVKVAREVGSQRFYETARSFGFGVFTGVDLPAEDRGLLLDPRRWLPIHFANLAFGQGILVNPLQVVCAYAAVANGGQLLRPQVVERIVDENGTTLKRCAPDTVRRVVSQRTAQVMTDLLVGVVEEGTGRGARIAGLPIAGKTGTAQKVDPHTHGYAPGKTVASFVGFLPASEPSLVIMVVVDEPAGGLTGGVVCAPVFRRVVEKILAVPNGPLADWRPLPDAQSSVPGKARSNT